MKNKGFTLIELIFVIVILSLLSLILVPTIQNLINKNTENMCDTLNDSIKSAAKEYLVENKYELSIICDTTKTIKLKELVDNNYIKGPIKNPKTKNELNLNTEIITYKYDCNKKEFEISYQYNC